MQNRIRDLLLKRDEMNEQIRELKEQSKKADLKHKEETASLKQKIKELNDKVTELETENMQKSSPSFGRTPVMVTMHQFVFHYTDSINL